MTAEIALTLIIIGAAIYLFATEKLRVDLIAMLVLLSLILTGLVPPQDAFSGFASPAVITVWAVYIVSGGLFRTGVADALGQRILRLSGNSEPRLIAVIMLTCGLMSAFMNNIGATAVLLPAVVGISRQSKVPLSRLLIPLSFASLMGGNMTLIGTPPNVIAQNILAERGLPTFSFFDFTPMGSLIFGAGIIYMVLLGRHLLPIRDSAENRPTASMLREYVSEVNVPANSPLVGQTLIQSRLGADHDLTVIALIRQEVPQRILRHDTRIQGDDRLIIKGAVEKLLQAQQQLQLVIETEQATEIEQLDSPQVCLVEATLAPRSSLMDRSLGQLYFRDRYGFTVLAIRRQGEMITQHLRDLSLQFGDALLLQGPDHRLPELFQEEEFLVLEPIVLEHRRRHKAPLAVGIMVLVLGLVTVGNFHISTAMVIGAVLMALSGCLTMDEAYQSIEWRSVFLIAGMLPLGLAMETTGTAQFLADLVIMVMGGWGALGVLAGIYILAGLITEPMSNAAATVLVVPIAIDIALELGLNPQTFVLAAVIGASTSFLTPVGHQANVLVFGPGGYHFFDYTRVGVLLNIVLLIVTLIFLPVLWPL